MKKKWIFGFGVLLVFGFVSFPCYSQSTTNEQRLIGTWGDQYGESEWQFKSDGTCTWLSGGSMFFLKYRVTGGKIVLDNTPYQDVREMEFFVSANGRTLVLIYVGPGSDDGRGIILKKTNESGR